VEAAVVVILEHGIDGATRARIADRAGVRPSALHHFMGTQDEVLRAAIDHIAQLLTTSLIEPDGPQRNPRAVLAATVDLAFGHAVDRPEVNQLLDELVAHSYRDSATAETLAAFYRGVTDDLAEQVRQAWPSARPADARITAAEIIALVHSAGTFRHLGLDELAVAAHRRARILAERDPSGDTTPE
jgi:AcrR family transcriptional regulator